MNLFRREHGNEGIEMMRSAQRTDKAAAMGTWNGTAPATALREKVADALERLSRILVAHTSRDVMMAEPGPTAPELSEVQEAVRFFGQVAAAWADVPDDALPGRGAGYASTVAVEDLDHGTRESFTIMAGPLLDLDAGQVSLASPIGQALLRSEEGDVVSVRTPQRLRRLRIVEVRTLQDRIAEENSVPLPAA